MQYLYLLWIVVLVTFGCEGNWWHTHTVSDKTCRGVCTNPDKQLERPEGYCEPTPYIPGGGDIIIESFDAPKAELQHNAIANIAKNVGFEVDVSSDLSAIVAATKKAAKTAEKLAAHLGIWGSAFSLLSSATSPTADDIMTAVNTAIGELTDLVNDQFTNMKGYVDHKILEQASDVWADQYSKQFTLFSGCLKYDSQGWDRVIKCLEDNNADSQATFATFMDYKSEMNTPDWDPDVQDVKHMEVQFNIYNNWAHLRMVELLTLFGEYKDKTDQSSRGMAKTYLLGLQSESLLYRNYTQFCFDKIVGKYTGYDHAKWVDSIDCPENPVTNKCEKDPILYKNTHSLLKCNSLFDEVSLLSDQVCWYSSYVFTMGQDPGTDGHILCPPVDPSCDKTCFAYFAYADVMKDQWSDFHDQLCNQVINFWTPSVLKSQEAYLQIYDAATEKLKEYGDVSASAPKVEKERPKSEL